MEVGEKCKLYLFEYGGLSQAVDSFLENLCGGETVCLTNENNGTTLVYHWDLPKMKHKCMTGGIERVKGGDALPVYTLSVDKYKLIITRAR